MALNDIKVRFLQAIGIYSPDDDTISVKNKMEYSELFPIENDGDIVYKAYIDNISAIENPTTAELTVTELDAEYPLAVLGLEIICEDITDNPLIYKKTASSWKSIPLGGVAP